MPCVGTFDLVRTLILWLNSLKLKVISFLEIKNSTSTNSGVNLNGEFSKPRFLGEAERMKP